MIRKGEDPSLGAGVGCGDVGGVSLNEISYRSNSLPDHLTEQSPHKNLFTVGGTTPFWACLDVQTLALYLNFHLTSDPEEGLGGSADLLVALPSATTLSKSPLSPVYFYFGPFNRLIEDWQMVLAWGTVVTLKFSDSHLM